MSWIVITGLIVIASLACALGMCEWIVRRRRDNGHDGRDDTSAMG